ncbi:Peptidoglycan/LPS O-acetylase OafA/YrhL, contains acyltransferase and SGNH-hydrolase domains [Streptoalloteichus tenebrarius]|uniref:Peptidoglycan/LPS O-acetylase OafA/YrhL, contains acyltransferase and SGNH-hydrolase domains n=1 Tax=Streptoalloteichus tenebrarius (strain ATCC 17920 / DSM 40477 / JCM 4838 / CBS 697.72 / NBRC 16177 / NCIMB 11028 / NRRL B-12390 / A12253. 1 / ISP 5477) TaxID=1933 RepID=A0ABT1HYX0_STRSD|nr:hypothetical protein [Streptoalloteichus tenebrarius]MCP2260555.1 Peptidoglycan/LPS O-acetylase OafA/YrhL, contains acyltransferase and SGNH-hydrolase domains [Streptoalloteichus tenebrarius]BFF01896.1 hypothetical protein GCM10020241_35710 [Streptoalloteichus tenebrarius]
MSDRASPRAPLSLDMARGLGACLVLYSYVVALRPDELGSQLTVVGTVRAWLNRPLGIGEDFGFFGLALLLVAGGYLAAAAAAESGVRGVLGRLLAVYPPFAFAVTVAALLSQLGAPTLSVPRDAEAGLSDWLASLALLGNVRASSVVLLELSWITAAEVLFVLCTALLAPVLRRAPWAPVVVKLLVVAVVVASGTEASGVHRGLTLVVLYTSFLLVGELAWAVRAGRLPTWAGVLLGCSSWLCLAWAERKYRELFGWWNALALFYAAIVFVLMVRFWGGRRSGRATGWLADRAYALVFLQGTVGWAVLDLLHRLVPVELAVPLALLSTVGVAEISHWLVERPAGRLARRLSGSTSGGGWTPDDDDTVVLRAVRT